MKFRIQNPSPLILSALLSAIAPLVFASSASANSEADIAAALKTAQNDQIQMSNFLMRFGVEVVKEQNFQETGAIHGQIGGSMSGLTLGNVSALANGILGLAAGSTSTNPFSSSGLDPLSSVLQGLQGWGYTQGSIQGSLSGFVEATGQKINDQANSFLVVGKNRSAFANVVAMKAKASSLGISDTTVLDQLIGVLNSPYIVDDGQVAQFSQIQSEFRTSLQTIDTLMAENVGNSSPVFDRVETISTSLKSWAASKRVSFALAGKGPIPVGITAQICSIHISNPSYSKGCGAFFEDGGELKELNQAVCIDAPLNGWQSYVDQNPPSVTDPQTGLTGTLAAFCKGVFNQDSIPLHSVFEAKNNVKFNIPGVADGTAISTLFNPNNMEVKADQYLYF